MKLAIIFGGTSYEHEISIVSAITLKKALSKESPIFIFLDIKREFYLIPQDKMNTKTFSSGIYKKEKRLNLISGGFEYKTLFLKELYSDLRVINLIHGGDGEDGVIVSLFDFYNIKYISPNREASIISYNKHLTKIFAQSLEIKTLPYEILHKGEERKLRRLSYPVIVKPLRLGSSIGVSIVREAKELEYALDTAYQYDDTIIVEEFINGVKEYNLAGTYTDRLVLSKIEEPQKGEILDFETKYMDFSRDEVVESADIPQDIKKKLEDSFKKIYLPMFKGALIRCDFFVIDGDVYLNEINSVPGSLANYLFNDFPSLIKSIQISKPHHIQTNYRYINRIAKAKG